MAELFPLGRIVITSHALETLHPDDTAYSLALHSHGIWGDLEEVDKQRNENAVKSGGRIFSSYKDRNGRRYWIVTEADPAVTTILLPEDY